jgi:hypothetical protein
LQAAGTAGINGGGTDKNMVVNAYDNNLIPMLASDPRKSNCVFTDYTIKLDIYYQYVE